MCHQHILNQLVIKLQQVITQIYHQHTLNQLVIKLQQAITKLNQLVIKLKHKITTLIWLNIPVKIIILCQIIIMQMYKLQTMCLIIIITQMHKLQLILIQDNNIAICQSNTIQIIIIAKILNIIPNLNHMCNKILIHNLNIQHQSHQAINQIILIRQDLCHHD